MIVALTYSPGFYCLSDLQLSGNAGYYASTIHPGTNQNPGL